MWVSNSHGYSNELYHHGIKGMKWGYRDVFKARKLYKQQKKNGSLNRKNYLKVSKKYNKLLSKAEEHMGDSDSAYDNFWNINEKGKKAVHEAMLKDIGYDSKTAKAGAEWMQKKRWNIMFNDYVELHK